MSTQPNPQNEAAVIQERAENYKFCGNCIFMGEGKLNGKDLLYCIASPESEEGNTAFDKARIVYDEQNIPIYQVTTEDKCVSLRAKDSL